VELLAEKEIIECGMCSKVASTEDMDEGHVLTELSKFFKSDIGWRAANSWEEGDPFEIPIPPECWSGCGDVCLYLKSEATKHKRHARCSYQTESDIAREVERLEDNMCSSYLILNHTLITFYLGGGLFWHHTDFVAVCGVVL